MIATKSTRLISCIGPTDLKMLFFQTRRFICCRCLCTCSTVVSPNINARFQSKMHSLFYLCIKFFYTLFHVMAGLIHAIDILYQALHHLCRSYSLALAPIASLTGATSTIILPVLAPS